MPAAPRGIEKDQYVEKRKTEKGNKEEKENEMGKCERGVVVINGEGREGEAPAKKFLSPHGIDRMTFVPGLLFTQYKCRHIFIGWWICPV
jgi:hypothetical protein